MSSGIDGVVALRGGNTGVGAGTRGMSVSRRGIRVGTKKNLREGDGDDDVVQGDVFIFKLVLNVDLTGTVI